MKPEDDVVCGGDAKSVARLSITEQENSRTGEIDKLSILEIVRLMNEEDALVAEAVGRVLPDIAQAVEEIVGRLSEGGHLFYVGTGTSGRLGVLDAAECPPTFGVAPDLVQGIIAGGYKACYRAVEASEDDSSAGARDVHERGVAQADALVGIAASGTTPYTIGALEAARGRGALTIALTASPDSEIMRAADISIVPVVGPEVITGSTRLKAGTAQKMVLNMLSTAAMIRLGYVSGNRMSNLQARNHKLRERAVRILCSEANLSQAKAREALEAAGGNLSVALVMSRAGCSREAATESLSVTKGHVEQAVAQLLS